MQRFFLIATAVLFLLEFYVYQAFKTLTTNSWLRAGFWVFTVAVYAFIAYELLNFRRETGDHRRVHIISTVLLAFVLPKIFIALFLFAEDIYRLIRYVASSFAEEQNHMPSRREFISVAGFGLAGIFSALILDGVAFGKYRHYVRRVKIKIQGLPKSFQGYRIVQFSDLHAGSFQNPEKMQHAFDLMNEQKADLILFTGDAVNNFARELDGFIPMMKGLNAKDGKFSVLGNHDYGSYAKWESAEEHRENVPNIIRSFAKGGFRLLMNEHISIDRDGEKLYLLGVENWGLPPFPQYGNINKASNGIPAEAPKILMSHDPTHFDEIVKKHPANIHLTLSGHTHGMQFGLNLKNVKWSPVQYRYKKWADLYESEGKYLYVNRGFGVIGFPGRVGMRPEITVFELS